MSRDENQKESSSTNDLVEKKTYDASITTTTTATSTSSMEKNYAYKKDQNKRSYIETKNYHSSKSDSDTEEKKTPKKKNKDGLDDTTVKTSKDYYFDSYSHYGIHEEMLKDRVRTETYRSAILENPQLFENKVVLDVGTGTGILSMFACQAGAKHVYGVDMSDIIEKARLIVEKNGFADRITLIKGKIEEIELPISKVDIIISEWMGYFLLYESMLDSVIYARDKWLIPGGIMFPDKAVLYLAAVEDGHYKKERIDFWNDVYGFDYTPIRDVAKLEPIVDIVEGQSIVTDAAAILDIDILTCTKDHLAFHAPFCLTALRNDYVHGLVSYFECAFTQMPKPIGFSTSPRACYTHWKQTLFYLDDTLSCVRGEQIQGTISCKPNMKNNRDLDISVSVSLNGMYSKGNQELVYYLR